MNFLLMPSRHKAAGSAWFYCWVQRRAANFSIFIRPANLAKCWMQSPPNESAASNGVIYNFSEKHKVTGGGVMAQRTTADQHPTRFLRGASSNTGQRFRSRCTRMVMEPAEKAAFLVFSLDLPSNLFHQNYHGVDSKELQLKVSGWSQEADILQPALKSKAP